MMATGEVAMVLASTLMPRATINIIRAISHISKYISSSSNKQLQLLASRPLTLLISSSNWLLRTRIKLKSNDGDDWD
jgi:hypothetical protein